MEKQEDNEMISGKNLEFYENQEIPDEEIQELMDTEQFSAAQLTGKQQGNTITRAVGGEPNLYLDWVVAGYEAGTQFLLCSDGLTKEVPEPKIEEEFLKNMPPKETAESLLQAALAAGGRDNVTVVVVRAE